MSVFFEKLTFEHQEEVIRILNHYIEETTSAYLEDTVSNDFFLNFINEEEIYCGFAIKDEKSKIVGFCTLEPYKPISTFSEIAEPMYFLDPDHTGKGIGTLVLKKLESEALKRGIKKLLVDISSENHESVKFHNKNGFVECGRLKDAGKKFNRYFSIVLMEKGIL